LARSFKVGTVERVYSEIEIINWKLDKTNDKGS